MENMDKGLTNAPKFICQICLPKPKSLGFLMKKKLYRVSVVRDENHVV